MERWLHCRYTRLCLITYHDSVRSNQNKTYTQVYAYYIYNASCTHVLATVWCTHEHRTSQVLHTHVLTTVWCTHEHRTSQVLRMSWPLYGAHMSTGPVRCCTRTWPLYGAHMSTAAVSYQFIIAYWYSPDCLKLAKVTPIKKGGDSTNAGNYRPISV